MKVSPAGFACMTKILTNIQSKVVLALEGGYLLEAINLCSSECIKALLGIVTQTYSMLTLSILRRDKR